MSTTVERAIPQAGEPMFITRTIEAQDIDEDSRTVRFVASDETLDRYGDIVRCDWNLVPFKKNPVFLWNHSYGVPPIGTIEPVEVVGKKLMASARFAAAGVSDFADQLFRLVRAKILRAVSVGFTAPREKMVRIEDDEGRWTGGIEWNEPELLEVSLVAVPANPKALAVARALGMPSEILSRVMPDASVIEHQRKVFAAQLADRVREVRLYGPR